MVSLVSGETSPGVARNAVSDRKRKQSDVDCSPQSSQSKRLRVTFDPAVDVQIIPDWDGKSLELVSLDVRRALTKRTDGCDAGCDNIKALLITKPMASEAPTTRLLHKYVVALAEHALSLDKAFSDLVQAVLDCHWAARNPQFVRAYRRLLQSLLSMHPEYAPAIFRMIVKMFCEDDPVVDRPTIMARAHDCLRLLLRESPEASTHLSPILRSAFPFHKARAECYVLYVENLLRVSKYRPELNGEILTLIVDKLVKIDVQLQEDIEDWEDEPDTWLFKQDDADDDVSDSESVSSEESVSPEEQVKDSVAKVDGIMDLLFEHYTPTFVAGDQQAIDDAFDRLLSQFVTMILPAYRSRHTQFLLFHFGQTSPDKVEAFAAYCSFLALDIRRPQVLRVAAAAYLASFVARGARVSAVVVRDIVGLLCDQLESIRAAQEPACVGPDVRRYGTYYAIAQALLYIFCFRWRDLIATNDDEPVDDGVLDDAPHLVWHGTIQTVLWRNILCKLNPLKVCSPHVVQQFARIAYRLHFVYVYPLIETNKRIRLTRTQSLGYHMDNVGARETALTMKKGEESMQLEAYFPFDPYSMPRSKRWLVGDYLEWEPIPDAHGDEVHGLARPEESDADDAADSNG